MTQKTEIWEKIWMSFPGFANKNPLNLPWVSLEASFDAATCVGGSSGLVSLGSAVGLAIVALE